MASKHTEKVAFCCVFITGLCNARILQLCTDSIPPCVNKSIESQHVCEGEAAEVAIIFELFNIFYFPPEKITAMRMDQAIISGLQLQGILVQDENKGKWNIDIHYQSGNLINFEVRNRNVQNEDQFDSHFALSVDNDVLETTPSQWFILQDCHYLTESLSTSCTHHTTKSVDAVSNGIIDTPESIADFEPEEIVHAVNIMHVDIRKMNNLIIDFGKKLRSNDRVTGLSSTANGVLVLLSTFVTISVCAMKCRSNANEGPSLVTPAQRTSDCCVYNPKGLNKTPEEQTSKPKVTPGEENVTSDEQNSKTSVSTPKAVDESPEPSQPLLPGQDSKEPIVV